MPTVRKPSVVGLPAEKSMSDVIARYNPKHWGYALSNPDKAYMADSPTLMGLNKKFNASQDGKTPASAWIATHLFKLFESSSSKNDNIAKSIISFAEAFANDAAQFKLTELMIFFARYQAGRYGQDQYAFDPRRIGNVFRREFLPDRNAELARLHRKSEQDRIEQERFETPEGYTSQQLYQLLKKKAEEGDSKAAELIGSKHTEEDYTAYLRSLNVIR